MRDGWIMTLLTHLLQWCGTELPWNAAVAMSTAGGEEQGNHTEILPFNCFSSFHLVLAATFCRDGSGVSL